MKNIFNYLNYKDYLKEQLHAKEARGTQSKLARHLECQAAYLYQILKSKGDLTEDQAYRVTTFFKLSPTERDYFLLLVRYAKAGSQELQTFIKQELQNKITEELDLKNKADSKSPGIDDQAWNYYFSSQLPSYIHILTSSDKYQTAQAISEKLLIPHTTISKHLKSLSEYGFVTSKNGRWHHATPSIHFPKSSNHNVLLQIMRRSQSLQSLMIGKNDEQIHFSTLFTLDEKSYHELRIQIANLVQKAQTTIHKGGTDEMYIMCVDLFSPTIFR